MRVPPDAETRVGPASHRPLDEHPDQEGGEDQRVLCEHAGRCGGCPLIAMRYSEQLAQKGARVLRSALRFESLELTPTEPIVGAESLVEYRTRAKLIVAAGGTIGLFAKGGGHQVVDIPGCRVLSPVLARTAARLRLRVVSSEMGGGPLAPCDDAGRGVLRAVDLREVRGDGPPRVLVTFVINGSRQTDLTLLRAEADELMRTDRDVIGVAANLHGGDTPQVLAGETVLLGGVTSAPDRIGGSVHFATFGSFVQTHRGQAARVHAILAEVVGQCRGDNGALRVLDLYGGSGAIALGLAALGASVHLIESFAPAAGQARAAARAQGLDVEVQCGDVAGALRGLFERAEQFDAAVLNPPRRGASPATREWLARLQPSHVAYVSCDPETLARDLDHLARLGYATTSLRPVDMIPLTEEVETVAVLRRGRVPAPRVVFENDEILVVEKGPHEPTTPQSEYASSLQSRVRLVEGAKEAVPLQKLDVGTSGLVMLVRNAEFSAKWSNVLSSAFTRRIYVAGVRGVTPSKGAIGRGMRDESKVARTRYRRLAVASGQSVLRVVPDQERPHQIRRHFGAAGHPILGDDRYGHAPTNRYFEEKNMLDRTFLHLLRLEFDDPDTHARRVLEAPLPGDLRGVLERISGAGTLRFLDHKNALGTRRSLCVPAHPHDSREDVEGAAAERESALDFRSG